MAFISGGNFAGHRTTSKTTCNRARNGLRMSAKKDEDKVIVTLDDLKRDEKRSGWTFFSENWNGRLAMLGMIIAIGTEQINPAHPTIIQQLGALVGQ
mmetsp:Transcript_14556/g.21243  ORF Transcript_14556/g.21243 Transcript_14556/m.21243 type:complete len:97 (-) Transcript_14556:161-451(-)|eukprot:CAMPEP_0184747740 /NCGR_PEP_ID=MMETSP0315-20130426/13189_1 /TAXON_ID=101924 /ORGANISM="Rhodosorus marinus, Strain UTEX LB 2760" /LENGTH=96 /DNA_ID=CAMNT_0027221503 /DNA_START=61 /DNA_END=351 /DNA_ORIENTATION=-